MHKLYAALAVLPLLAAPVSAQCCGCGLGNKGGVLNFGFGANFTFYGNYACGPYGTGQPYGGGGGGGPQPGQLGPWYMYWPMEAHFQAPAPTGYPYWPAAQTLPNGSGSVPNGNGKDVSPMHYLQPAAYAPGVPSYWYGR